MGVSKPTQHRLGGLLSGVMRLAPIDLPNASTKSSIYMLKCQYAMLNMNLNTPKYYVLVGAHLLFSLILAP